MGRGAREHHPAMCITSNSATHARGEGQGCQLNSTAGQSSGGSLSPAPDPAHQVMFHLNLPIIIQARCVVTPLATNVSSV